MRKKRDQTPKPTARSGAPSELPTFLEHVHELRRRLFWVVAVTLITSAAAYPFLDTILSILTAPLGGQQLYYLTPIGGFSFSVKICFYVGILAAVPIIMYHLYRYVEPLMGQRLRRSALFYVGLSALMAGAGILFAYFVSLPGALHFLTGMDLKNIQAMLTVDSYLTFVMTYLLGAALLFQIPLLLTIINNMTPLQPQKLMKLQRYVIVAAFIIAAVISPTPDIMNQLLLALPVIAMYQIGVLLVWLQNRSRARRAKKQAPVFELQSPAVTPIPGLAAPGISQQAAPQASVRPVARASLDGFGTPHKQPVAAQIKASMGTVHVQTTLRTTLTPARQSPPLRPAKSVSPRALQVPARSIDGFTMHRPGTQVVSSS